MARAEAEFKRAVAADPKSVPARLALANLYWSTNRRPEAEAAIKEASALGPV
jgi:Tfp pilus assembly protein PilF